MNPSATIFTASNLSKWLIILAVSVPVAIYFGAWVEHGKQEVRGPEREAYLPETEGMTFVPERIYVETTSYRYNPLWMIAVFAVSVLVLDQLLKFAGWGAGGGAKPAIDSTGVRKKA